MWVPKKKETGEPDGDGTPPEYPPGLEPAMAAPSTAGVSEPSSSDESSASSCPESPKASARGGLRLASLPRSAKRFIAPLDVRFSQMKMRHLFGDGRRVAVTVQQIKAIKVSKEEAKKIGAPWKLQVPFPTIEVIRWRAKLRDEDTGRPKVDASGEELLDTRAHWFTLDNRRLYCLQEAALTVWPERSVVEVAEVKSGPQANIMELRKFRTLDRGRSIKIGSVSDKVPFVRWSWMQKVGINDLASDSSGPDSEVRHKKIIQERGGAKVWNTDVLDHLASLKQDDHDRIEISKKLSWILRRGAKSISVDIDDDGWVKTKDLLEVEFLGHVQLDTLLAVIEQSNKQKRRYELKDVNDEQFVRATTKRGTDHAQRRKEKSRIFAEEKPWESSKAQVASSRNAAKAAIRAVPITELQKEEEKNAKPKNSAKAKAKTEEKREERKGQDIEAATATPKNKVVSVEVALPKKGRSAAAASVPTAPSPQAMQAFYKNLAAMQAMAIRQPPAQVLQQMNAMRHMQMMAQMQAMYFQHQMAMQHQLAAISQMTVMRQMQAMRRMQDHMQQMQQMQDLMEEIGELEEEDEDTDPDKEQSLEAKIAEALEAAKKRSTQWNTSAPDFVPSGLQQDAACDEEDEEDDEDEEEPTEPEASVDIQTKIAEAMAGARARNNIATAPFKPPERRPAPSKTTAEADIQSKINEALNAAKARQPVAPTAVAAPKKTSSAAARVPAPDEDIQSKFQEALEAARKRNGA